MGDLVETVDLAALLAPRATTDSGMPEDTVTVRGIGTVKVRGLSRTEALKARDFDGPGGFERALLTFGMLDPKLTEAQAAQWQEIGLAGELRDVTDKIVELSGMGDGASKEAFKSAGDEPGTGE